ncbi:unnamed protein product [Aphanomyces euteiches]
MMVHPWKTAVQEMQTSRRCLTFDLDTPRRPSKEMKHADNRMEKSQKDPSESKKRKHHQTPFLLESKDSQYLSRTESSTDKAYLSPEPSSAIEGVNSLSPQAHRLHPSTRSIQVSPKSMYGVIDLTEEDEDTPKPKSVRWTRASPTTHVIPQGSITGPIFDLTDDSTTPTLGCTEALKFIRMAYREFERDDRDIYKISDEVLRTEMATCETSQLIQQATPQELYRMTTYGEIKIEDFSKTIIPLLQLTESDVFYDLGCGTAKPVLQVSLETTCRVSKGIELFLNRVETGQRALDRLHRLCPSVVDGKDIRIVQGDLVEPPPEAHLLDATVVFINNVVFTDDLMLAVMDKLRRMRKLKRVIVSKKLCDRHVHKLCARSKNACTLFQHPPRSATVEVTWTREATVYVYQRMHCV